jgi:type II secretory pathway pseudopilin PulG
MWAGRSSHVGIAAGFTYLGVLFLIVFMGLGLAAVAHVWHVTIQRDKEAELLFAGGQFRDAIKRYSEISPGNASKQEFPQKLEDLLEDKRFGAFTMRHLRKIYVDPMTGKPDWDLVVLPGIGIVGVHSKSDGTPIKASGFPKEFDKFSEAKNYTDWVFTPGAATPTAPPAGSQGAPAAAPVTAPGGSVSSMPIAGGMPTPSGMPPPGGMPIPGAVPTPVPGQGLNPGPQPLPGNVLVPPGSKN